MKEPSRSGRKPTINAANHDCRRGWRRRRRELQRRLALSSYEAEKAAWVQTCECMEQTRQDQLLVLPWKPGWMLGQPAQPPDYYGVVLDFFPKPRPGSSRKKPSNIFGWWYQLRQINPTMASNRFTLERRNFQISPSIHRSPNKDEFGERISNRFHYSKCSFLFMPLLEYTEGAFTPFEGLRFWGDKLDGFLVEPKQLDCLYGRT